VFAIEEFMKFVIPSYYILWLIDWRAEDRELLLGSLEGCSSVTSESGGEEMSHSERILCRTDGRPSGPLERDFSAYRPIGKQTSFLLKVEENFDHSCTFPAKGVLLWRKDWVSAFQAGCLSFGARSSH